MEKNMQDENMFLELDFEMCINQPLLYKNLIAKVYEGNIKGAINAISTLKVYLIENDYYSENTMSFLNGLLDEYKSKIVNVVLDDDKNLHQGNIKPGYGYNTHTRILDKIYQYRDVVKNNSDKDALDILFPSSGREFNTKKLSRCAKPYLFDGVSYISSRGYIAGFSYGRKKPLRTIAECYAEYLDELYGSTVDTLPDNHDVELDPQYSKAMRTNGSIIF